jgi:hypothetical protein
MSSMISAYFSKSREQLIDGTIFKEGGLANIYTESNTTDLGEERYYRKNVNLNVDPWLHNFIVYSSIINLTLAFLTFAF